MNAQSNSSGARPPLYYGWVVVAVAFVSLFFSLGIRFTYSLFFVALTNEYQWDRALTSSIFSVSLVVFAALGPLLGYLLDRIGARVLFVTGSLFLALGLVASSTTRDYWQFLLYYGILASIGMAILSLGIHSIVLSRWFIRKRGLAIGLAFAGTGMGSLVLAPLVEQLITNYGWRNAFLALGVVVFALLIPANGIWARTRPQEKNLQADGERRAPALPNELPRVHHTVRGVLTNWRFWLLAVSTFLAMVTVRLMIVHAVPHLVDVGFTSLFAATVFGATGGVEGVSTIAWGWLSDRIGRVWSFALGSLCVIISAALLLWLEHDAEPLAAFGFALMFGMGDSSRASLLNALAGDLFEGPELGAISGYLITAFALGGAFGPWLGGYIFDLSGHYTLAFWLGIFATVLATIGVFIAGRNARVAHHAEPIEV